MINKETIKSWFRNGSKPTEKQFWAWMDSFFHKEEKIPMQSVEGMSEALEGKADATALSHYALKDKVYERNEINEFLDRKVDFPSQNAVPYTGIIASLSRQFLVGYEEDLNSVPGQETRYNSVRFDVSGITGKNIGNSDLDVPNGTIRTLDVTDAKLRIAGLEDKRNDASYNLKAVFDQHGNMALSSKEDVTFTFPQNFTANINVRHIYPNEVQEIPDFAGYLRRILEGYKNYQFTPITSSQWQIRTKENRGRASQVVYSDNSVLATGNDAEFNSYSHIEEMVSLTAPSVALPTNRDWILKIKCTVASGYSDGVTRIGVAQGDASVMIGVRPGRYDGFHILGTDETRAYNSRIGALLLIVKTGKVITVIAYGSGGVAHHSYSFPAELGEFSPKVQVFRGEVFSGSMEYKLL